MKAIQNKKRQQQKDKLSCMNNIYDEASKRNALDIMVIMIRIGINMTEKMVSQLKASYDYYKHHNIKFYKVNAARKSKVKKSAMFGLLTWTSKSDYVEDTTIYPEIEDYLAEYSKKYFCVANNTEELLESYYNGAELNEYDYYKFCIYVTSSKYTKNDAREPYFIECHNYLLSKLDTTDTFFEQENDTGSDKTVQMDTTHSTSGNNEIYIFKSNPLITFRWLADIKYRRFRTSFGDENQLGGKYINKLIKYSNKIEQIELLLKKNYFYD